jgi:PTS system cellobiose-specific IIC component
MDGGTGIFTGIVVSLVSTRVYIFIKQKGFTIRMPESVPPVVSSSFSSPDPWLCFNYTFRNYCYNIYRHAIQEYACIRIFIPADPLEGLGGNIITILIVWTFSQILWFMGIHGTMVVWSVFLPIITSMDAVQLSAYAAGEPLPNITGRAFISTYTMSASAIGFTLLMLFAAKSQQYKALGKLTTLPALFGISEPLVFGTPLVFNFRFIIPFVFMNAISLGIAYVVTYVGIVPRVAGITPITVCLSSLTGSWKEAGK